MIYKQKIKIYYKRLYFYPASSLKRNVYFLYDFQFLILSMAFAIVKLYKVYLNLFYKIFILELILELFK